MTDREIDKLIAKYVMGYEIDYAGRYYIPELGIFGLVPKYSSCLTASMKLVQYLTDKGCHILIENYENHPNWGVEIWDYGDILKHLASHDDKSLTKAICLAILKAKEVIK